LADPPSGAKARTSNRAEPGDEAAEGDGRAPQAALAALKARHAGRGGTVEVAYWAIRDAIRTGVLRPGDRLIEVDLAAALETSRTPIREALRRLESDRLVDNAPRRGLVVPTASLDDLIEIFEIREVLEGLAARRAAQRMGEAELEALGETVERMERAMAADDLGALAAASHHFHRHLRAGSRHSRLPSMISLLGDTTRSLNAHQLAPERVAGAVAEHRAIYEAIAARDADAAERVTRQHSRNALRAQILAHHLAAPD
jgi:DNA-binding GntR family transcriptional regulator